MAGSKYEVHGFCDGSKSGLACVLYLLTITENNRNSVGFICGRARVTLIKPITIPRIELLSCLLLSNTYDQVKSSLPPHKLFLWNDSLCSLCWIKNTNRCWRVWVESRVGIIRKLTDKENWYHVPSTLNSADVGTRAALSLDF